MALFSGLPCCGLPPDSMDSAGVGEEGARAGGVYTCLSRDMETRHASLVAPLGVYSK